MMYFFHYILTNMGSNQYTPSTHHLHTALKLTTPLHQSSLRTDQAILTPKILIITHFLTYIYIIYIILTEIIIIFNSYGVRATQQTTFVPWHFCNYNITLKMAPIAAATCWWEYSE
jgi:hypothetical protein